MAVNLSPVGGVAGQFFDNNGVPLAGGKLYTYSAGTTTNQTTYTSSAGVTAHTNPIVLDGGGRVPGGEIWLTDGLSYKFVLKNASDVLIGTYDNIIGINSNFVNFLTETEVQTATAGQTVFTLTTMQYQPGTNNLTVYVDGVNQIDGSTYSYVETSATVVTFTAGLHIGALVKFTTAQTLSTGVTDASLVTYDPPFTGSVATTVENKLAQTVSVADFGAVGDGATDDAPAFQAAIDYLHSINGGTLYVPYGRYKFDSYVTVYNFIRIEGWGFGNTGTVFYGSTIIVNNATAAFLSNGVQRFELCRLSFVAAGAGIGAAHVYMGQTTGYLPPYNYTSKMLIEYCKISANMGGGFYGNFIYGVWSNTEFGFDGTPGTYFQPIRSIGDITGNSTNANTISLCRFVQSRGDETVYFQSGSDLTIQNCTFEINSAQYTIHCSGIAKTTIKDCYFETNNGALTAYPITFENGPGSACLAITFTGNLCSLGANNTHLIRATGSSGLIFFEGNIVYGTSGKHITSTQDGDDKGFSLYESNYLDALTITPNAYSVGGTFTPLITGTTGTNVHTYVTQAGHWERRGNMVDVQIFVRISAKDVGSGGFVQITGLSGLPVVDATVLATMVQGLPCLLSFYTGVTQAAGLTQLGAVLGSGNVITFLGSGSATAYTQLAMSGLANATQLCLTFSYPTNAV